MSPLRSDGHSQPRASTIMKSSYGDDELATSQSLLPDIKLVKSNGEANGQSQRTIQVRKQSVNASGLGHKSIVSRRNSMMIINVAKMANQPRLRRPAQDLRDPLITTKN